MGILDNIGIGKKLRVPGRANSPAPGAPPGSGARGKRPAGAAASRGRAGASGDGALARLPGTGGGSPKPGKGGKGGKRRKGGAPSPRERIAGAAAPLHDRRRRLVGAREATLRDLGGLMLEMYKRNRFREELLLDKCEEVLAIEVEIAHVDQRLFQLAPPNAAGMRPIGRCDCGAPIHPGQNFCGVCGRSFATLTQGRSCARCGAGLRPGDQFCATCGSEAPDSLQTLEAVPTQADPAIRDATRIATSAVADTVILEPPPPLDPAPTPAPAANSDSPATAARDSTPELPPIVEPPTPAVHGAAPEAGTGAQAAPGADPAQFTWSAPPAAPDVAIDAAVDAAPPAPTDAATPYAGFPLGSTVPPPPSLDPSDPAQVSAPQQPAPVRPAQPAQPTQPPPAVGEHPQQVADQAAATAVDPAAAKARAKAAGLSKKQREKAAKARAKQRAKAAREARKRGEAE